MVQLIRVRIALGHGVKVRQYAIGSPCATVECTIPLNILPLTADDKTHYSHEELSLTTAR